LKPRIKTQVRFWNSGIREKALRNLLSAALSSEDLEEHSKAIHNSLLIKNLSLYSKLLRCSGTK